MSESLQAACSAEVKFPLLKNYKISQSQVVDFCTEFSLVLKNFGLSKQEMRRHSVLMDVKDEPGVYFLLMRLNDSLYKIYAGKTRCLRRRLDDYTNEFQVHSPNDYKLRFFRNFILKHEPKTEFDLYFQKCTKDTYTDRETAMIEKYRPLINQRGDGGRMVIQDAFEAYFSQSFERKLTGQPA